jgi:hypothetical protein
MSGTSVPEAAVNEDHDSLPRKHDVDLAPQSAQRSGVLSEAQAASVQLGSDRHFGTRVASAVALHDGPHLDGGGRRSARVAARQCVSQRYDDFLLEPVMV